MKDQTGKTINIGDTAFFKKDWNWCIGYGTVTEFTPRMVKLTYFVNDQLYTQNAFPNHVILGTIKSSDVVVETVTIEEESIPIDEQPLADAFAE